MLPIASSGPPIIFGTVAAAVLFLWWLLRAESRAEAEEVANGEQDGAQETADHDGFSAP